MLKKRIKSTVILLFIFFFSGQSCSKEEIKKSEDSIRIHALYDALDRLKKNFEAKDASAFLSDFSAHYPDYEKFKTETRETFTRFGAVHLNLYLDHIILESSVSSLMIRWEGEWTHPSEGLSKGEGNTLLKFSNDPLPLLIGIEGSNPFLPPIKEKRS